jgi:glycerol-3-phosphate dehydrogenase
MRNAIETLDGEKFDVLVIGAGVSGANTVESLAVAGYKALIVDKGDFGSGATSKASKIAHCGLIYLAPIKSAWEYVADPRKLLRALRIAAPMMKARADLVRNVPHRMRGFDFYYPIYKETPYSPWQARLGFRMLAASGPKDVPLQQAMVKPSEVRSNPLLSKLRDFDKIKSFARFREYQFNWQERLCVDAVMRAERLGAKSRNYCEVTKATKDAAGTWHVELADRAGGNGKATVTAGAIVNAAGPWIDTVNGRFDHPVQRCVRSTKGVHMMVRLPEDCGNIGVVTSNELQGMFQAIPWRDGLYYFGPTETEHDGPITDVVPTEHDINLLLESCRQMYPALNLTRKDVVFAWAGLRPLTYNGPTPSGRDRKLHDIGNGLAKGFALTWGRLIDQRSTGALIAENIMKVLKPSSTPKQSAFVSPETVVSGSLTKGLTPEIVAELKRAARSEQVLNLADLLLRRTNIGFSDLLKKDDVVAIAGHVAPDLGWDNARAAAEVDDYVAYMKHNHLLTVS